MANHRFPARLQSLFEEALPLAIRAADVLYARFSDMARDAALDPDDFQQEVLLHVCRALPRFDSNRACLRTFVEKLAFSVVASICRRTTARKRAMPADYIGRKSFETTLQVELRLDLRRLVRKLSPRDRRVARLLLMNISPAEIASQLCISRAAVYRSMRRILAALEHGGFGHENFRYAGHFADRLRI
jgi:RNA polymerase sigma factor (sigma-70 family)